MTDIFDKLQRRSTGVRSSYDFNPAPYVRRNVERVLDNLPNHTEEYRLEIHLGVYFRCRPGEETIRAAQRDATRTLARSLYDEPLRMLSMVRSAIHAGDAALALRLCNSMEDAMVYGRET